MFAFTLITASLPGNADTYPVSAFKEGAQKCIKVRDLKCAEINWTQYVKMRPNDSHAKASLAIVLNWQDKPEASIAMAEQALEAGEGAYDLFAAYSESLNKVGRNQDAIDWGYKTLAVLPSLVNIRGMVAKLLSQQKREWEALTLLASYDAHLEASGHTPYFAGQRISIESLLEKRGELSSNKKDSLRLPKTNKYFYAPIKIGDAPMSAFVVDTGATQTLIPEDLLAKTKSPYKVLRNDIRMKTADGRLSTAKLVQIEKFKIGHFDSIKISAIVCSNCVALLGQTELARFNLNSSKTQGVEFLNLQSR